ncbi:predicted protein [Histoplasma capsulatum H143]|uniref:Uncharacterized protein n=1 Tax=Ajellomyces capsulatus (strain H143) TaxID=544712 RepID=C6H7F9_AJECH|nr:predicted protein [Histoplasma capsulatum H143]
MNPSRRLAFKSHKADQELLTSSAPGRSVPCPDIVAVPNASDDIRQRAALATCPRCVPGTGLLLPFESKRKLLKSALVLLSSPFYDLERVVVLIFRLPAPGVTRRGSTIYLRGTELLARKLPAGIPCGNGILTGPGWADRSQSDSGRSRLLGKTSRPYARPMIIR